MKREDVERLIDALGDETPAIPESWMESPWAEIIQAAEVLGALLERAERAEAERDAAFAAGQEDMRERAAVMARECFFDPEAEADPDYTPSAIRTLPIKPRPE